MSDVCKRPNKRPRAHSPKDPEPHVSIPESSATCTICAEIMHDPATVECACRRSFCLKCLEAWRTCQETCPLCNTSVPKDSKVQRGPAEWAEALDSVKRSCPNDPRCRFRRGTYRETRDHALTECPYRRVPCPNEACDEVLEHRNLRDHLRLCLLKRCKFFRPPRFGCRTMGTVEFIKQHESKCCFGEPEVFKQIEELTARFSNG